MLRRHRRGGRRFTVSIQRDFALVAGSLVPFQLQLAGDGKDKPGQEPVELKKDGWTCKNIDEYEELFGKLP
jgi:hypothetical protein